MRKWFAGIFRSPADKRLQLAKAWQRLQSGGGSRQDFEMVLADLVDTTGYYRRPSYASWMARTKTPQGFELHSALSNARAEVVQHIMGFLTLDDETMIALERAVQNPDGRA